MYIFFPNRQVGFHSLKHLDIPLPNKTPAGLPRKVIERDFLTLFRERIPFINDVPRLRIITVKSGNPFTIGRSTIVFPLAYFRQPRNTQKKILVHELVHLHQRRYPALYASYYQRLGFQKSTSADILPATLKAKLMYNPDGEHYEWIWRDRYMPVAVDHKSYLWDLRRQRLLPVDQVPDYANAFGTKRQLYHPNEIVAHQITDHLGLK
jgi:hypothetical protein